MRRRLRRWWLDRHARRLGIATAPGSFYHDLTEVFWLDAERLRKAAG